MSQTLSLMYFNLGKPRTRYFLESFPIRSMLACVRLLFQIYESSFILTKHEKSKFDLDSKSIIWMSFIFLPTSWTCLSLSFIIKHWLALKITWFSLSNNLLIISKLCLRPFTKKRHYLCNYLEACQLFLYLCPYFWHCYQRWHYLS